jgi:ornithine decarboxylase
MIQPYYAVKCNPLGSIVETFRKEGIGFDCASKGEIKLVSPSDIIYANPCKARPDIRFAAEQKVDKMTFDSVSELEKIYDEHPNPKPILRIHVDDKGSSRVPLNTKFGFHFNEIGDLIRFNKPVYGLAFHVGSDCQSPRGFTSAFQTVRQFMTCLQKRSFFRPEILDIGGGFSNPATFTQELAPEIRKQLIPIEGQFDRVIAEPGRFFVEPACTLKTPIIGQKVLADGRSALTVDESVYGLFSGILMDGFKPVFESDHNMIQCTFTVLGRTCDSADILAKDIRLPCTIKEGDILTVRNIGAYSWASASNFNGFEHPSVIVE